VSRSRVVGWLIEFRLMISFDLYMMVLALSFEVVFRNISMLEEVSTTTSQDLSYFRKLAESRV
jgi:hypothetical protein